MKLKDNACMIPNLAIHMNRDMNNGVALNPQVDMLPLITMTEEGQDKFSLNKALAEALSRQNGVIRSGGYFIRRFICSKL